MVSFSPFSMVNGKLSEPVAPRNPSPKGDSTLMTRAPAIANR